MANTLKLRGGTTAEVAAATLAEREIMVDTTKDIIVVGPTKKEMAVGNGGTYTGNYTFTNDVVISGSFQFGSSINANNVRIQNVATPTGNSDASNKSYVDGLITSVQNTTLPGNVFSADNTITITDNNPGVGDIDLGIANNSVSTAKIQDNAVTSAKFADGSVTSLKFGTASVTTAKIADQAVTTAKLEVSAVTSNRIAAGAVGSTKIADNGITAIKLQSDSITTDKIQDDAVTAAKIEDSVLASHAAQVTACANSATAAASSAASALAAFDNFDDTYLGAKASDPATDNDGDALTAGDLYFNTTTDVMKLYTGSGWVIAYVPGDAANITNAASGNLTSTNVQSSLQELQTDIDSTVTATTTNVTNIATNATNIATNATNIAARIPTAGGTFTGDVTFQVDQELRFFEAVPAAGGTGTQNYIGFKGPLVLDQSGGSEVNYILTLPTSYPDVAGKAIISDLSGNLSWGFAGGASGGGNDQWAVEHDNTITQSYTIGTGKNVISAGPLTVNSGATVTVPSGSNWVIV